jgi:hypothetical protein
MGKVKYDEKRNRDFSILVFQLMHGKQELVYPFELTKDEVRGCTTVEQALGGADPNVSECSNPRIR